MKLIGISGTNGSGKDSLGLLLAEKYGYLFVSGSDLLREECRRRNLPVERENLRMISAEWRREFGLGVITDKAVAKFNEAPGQYKGLAIASMRNPGEAERVHELGGIMVWTDADPRIRYERVTGTRREGRAEEDNKTFEQFMAEEAAEMQSSGDAATVNMSGVKAISDITIINNGNDLARYQADVAEALKDYL